MASSTSATSGTITVSFFSGTHSQAPDSSLRKKKEDEEEEGEEEEDEEGSRNQEKESGEGRRKKETLVLDIQHPYTPPYTYTVYT